MIRRNASRVFLPAVALLGFGLRVQAEPEKTIDARNCIPASAWAYVEGSTSQAKNWRELVLGGLPDADRQAAEKAFDELWDQVTRLASDEVGTDVGKFLTEIDRVHLALLDFHTVAFERDMGPGAGTYTRNRPEFDLLVALKSRTPGYFAGLLEGDLKKYVQPGPEYKTLKTWVIDTGAGHDKDMKTVSSVHLASFGDCIFASNIRATLEKALDAAGGAAIPGGPITANPDFMRAQKQAGQDPILLGFVNLRTLLTGVESSLDRDDLAEYQMSDAVAGQSTLRSAVVWGTMDGRYSITGGSIFLDANNEMWNILHQAPAPKNLLGVIPGKCIGCTIITLHEPEKLWEKIRAFVNEKVKLFVEPGETERQSFENGLAEMEEALGTTVAEILGAVDDEIGYAAIMPAEGRLDERGQIVFIELKDLDKAKAVIASLKEGEVIGRGGGELISSEYNGVTCWNAEGARFPFGYAIINKVFVITFDVEAQKAVIDAWKNGETLNNDKAYKAAMKKLPAENSKLIYYNYVAMARAAAEMSRELDPELLKKIKGDQGVAMVSIERPDELSFLCGTELSSELSASVIQSLLPMFNKEREAAERTKKLSVLRSLGTAASTWVSMEGDGSHFPTTLQSLVDAHLLEEASLKKADGTAGRIAYNYPVLAGDTAPEFVLAWDTDRLSDDFVAVLYFSGAVETIEGAKLAELLKKQNEQTLKDLPAAIAEAKEDLEGASDDQKKAIEARVKFLEETEAKLKADSQK